MAVQVSYVQGVRTYTSLKPIVGHITIDTSGLKALDAIQKMYSTRKNDKSDAVKYFCRTIRMQKMNYKYWVYGEGLDGFIAAQVVEEFAKLKGSTANIQDIYQNDKGLFDKVLDRIHQVHGKGPHDIDGKLIAVGDSIIIANGRNLIFGNVVQVTTSKVKVGIVRSTFNPKPAKVRNRTYMFPERMKVL